MINIYRNEDGSAWITGDMPEANIKYGEGVKPYIWPVSHEFSSVIMEKIDCQSNKNSNNG